MVEKADTPGEGLDERLTRPIIGIENRTAQEAFDIMSDRLRAYLAELRASPSVIGSDTAGLLSDYAGLVEQTLRDAKHVIQKTESLNDPRYHRATSILGRIDEAIAALSHAAEPVAWLCSRKAAEAAWSKPFPVYASPAPLPLEPTAKQVDAALDGFFGERAFSIADLDHYRRRMRAALVAARPKAGSDSE